MKVLSLLQPWATLVAIAGHPDPHVRKLGKRIETRSWSTPYRGPLAIHASKKWNADVVDWVMTSEETYPIRLAIRAAGYDKLADLPLGSILCITDLWACMPITKTNAPLEPERSYGDYSTQPKQRYAWHMTNVLALPEPIPAKGALGLWTPAPDVLATLEQFYAGVM